MSDFISVYNMRMHGIMQWKDLDALWQNICHQDNWYLYEIGRQIPDQTVGKKALKSALAIINTFLHEQHEKSYCGVVYANNLLAPSLLKIYHPRKMGTSCGDNGSTILPKWTLSTLAPIDLIEWSLAKDEKPTWWKHMLKKRV